MSGKHPFNLCWNCLLGSPRAPVVVAPALLAVCWPGCSGRKSSMSISKNSNFANPNSQIYPTPYGSEHSARQPLVPPPCAAVDLQFTPQGLESPLSFDTAVRCCRVEGLAAEAEGRRQALVPLAEQLLTQPSASPGDLRRAAQLLAEVAGRQHAQR